MNDLQLKNLFYAQRNYRWETKTWTAEHRQDLLRLLKAKLLKHQDEICQCLFADFGKAEFETWITELYPVLSELKLTIRNLKTWSRPQPVSSAPTLLSTKNWVQYEARGNVLIIAPWNYPFGLALIPLISAIAAGNTVILKPSELTPKTSALIAKILGELFEPHFVAVIEGDKEVSKSLLQLPFDHIFFTGSTAVGKIVMRAASEHLSSVTLELGGKSPAIVHSSSDLDLAAEKIAWGKLVNSGQTCIAPDYILVEDSVASLFTQKLQLAVSKLEDMASQAKIISQTHLERLRQLAEPHSLATARADQKLALQLISDPDLNSRLMTEEIFGPLLPIHRFNKIDEAISYIQDRAKPLALYLFAEDQTIVTKVLQQTSSGGVCINDTLIQLGNHHLPFGGVGESGLGNYHGRFGFINMSHQRAVLKQGWLGRTTRVLFPPYSRKRLKLIKSLIKWIS